MKVLVIGGGGREHAICWALARSPLVEDLYCAPGNPGIAAVADLVPLAADEIHELAAFAGELDIDLTVVGPELPLALGIVDEFVRRELSIFGPSRAGAQIEASKVFAKRFMERHDIPTAEFVVAHDRDEAAGAAREHGLPVALKADGLAGGKGVFMPRDDDELETALDIFFEERRFGSAADRVVVERFLTGEELSFLVLADGERVLPLAPCRDYKRIGEGDTGSNTGGMGAHSPSGLIERDLGEVVRERVIRPTIDGLAEENRTFRGVLYAGLMVTDDGPLVLEFNVRLGDPEAQAMLLRLEDDLAEVLAAGAAGEFGRSRLSFRKEAAACVVLASDGYPQSPVTGEPITGLAEAAELDDVVVFHAGTATEEGRTVTAGGRVINACAVGSGLREALRNAYGAAEVIDWPSKVYRRDIGRAVLDPDSKG